ncbi:MAG: trypsin-like peptidase domain-containing protein [Lachnospiraceae bacterium]|nr:trypsin-like peptidase domain-containing protein [Lachnospiraceae bacterium]
MDEQFNNYNYSETNTDNNNQENQNPTVNFTTDTTYRERDYRANYSYMDEKPKRVKKEKKPREKKSRPYVAKLFGAVGIGAVFGLCAAVSFYFAGKGLGFNFSKPSVEQSQEVATLQKSVEDLQKAVKTASSSQGTPVVVSDVTEVANKVMPSMVAITNNAVVTTYDMFGMGYESPAQASGSGIIIGESDSEYFIATNHHVIADNKTLEVLFADETTAAAFVKGYDESLDIAVIAVKKDGLSADTMANITVADIGDSDALQIGEPAIAIGNALGYGQSVTTGVVSALNRSITIDNVTYENLIQTSAAINPGNSGGALLNVYGQVIGINSSKEGGSEIEGMGFAIPISKVKDILQEFSDRETRTQYSDDQKGYLGIKGKAEDITAFGYPAGAMVDEVSKNSPADKAGIYKYDIITKVDGQSVKDLTSLQELLSYYAPDETVEVTLMRVTNGEMQEITVQVTLAARNSVS